MFKLLKRLLGGSPRPARPEAGPTTHARATTAVRETVAVAATADDAAADAVRQATERPRLDRSAPPEELCGLTPGMSQDEIRDHLALLYRRHNRAASSLDASLREEAEIMLDAVVRCRESLLGVPAAPHPADPATA